MRDKYIEIATLKQGDTSKKYSTFLQNNVFMVTNLADLAASEAEQVTLNKET